MSNELNVIKYVGGPHHITILCKKKNSNQLFIIYCYTGKLMINVELETFDTNKNFRYRTAEIKIPLNTNRHTVWYQIAIENEEQFDLIEKIVSSIMEDNK